MSVGTDHLQNLRSRDPLAAKALEAKIYLNSRGLTPVSPHKPPHVLNDWLRQRGIR